MSSTQSVLILSILVAFNACAPSTPSTEKPKDKPNIVILFCDDMGYGDMSNTGHPSIQTPNLDRLVQDGMRFTNFYSGSPACTASRYALLTGRYPVRSGFDWVLVPSSPRGIHPKEETIAEVLKAENYATACYGKWHLGTTKPAFLPTENGFDEYLGLPYSNDMIPPNWPDIPLLEGMDTLELNPNQSKLTRVYTERAQQFIRKNQDGSFFIYLPYAMPHIPLYPGPDFAGQSKRGAYGDVIEEIDWSVGQIRQTLDSLGLSENTLLFFTSDNGPWIIKNELGGSSGLFRDGKGSTWEGGMHVPGIAYWPETVPAGSMVDYPSSTLDLLPTIKSLLKLEDKTNVDGGNIAPILKAKEKLLPERPYFYYGLGNQLLAVRKGAWKLHIKTYSQTGKSYFEKAPPLLFNLDQDPSEQYELSESYPELVAELLQIIEAHMKEVEATGTYFD